MSESGYSSDEDSYYKNEMVKLRSNFKVLGLVRKSAHADIYLGRDRRDGSEVIMKVLKKKLGRTNKWCNEAKAHHTATIADPIGTAKLIGVYERFDAIVMVIEKPINSLDILEIINIYGPVNLKMTKQIVKQTRNSCLAYKAANLVHCDIKDENIMLNPLTGETKIIDFGNARPYGKGTLEAGSFGSVAFNPPEWSTGACTTTDTDSAIVYSLGCLAFIALTGTCPFGHAEPFDFQQSVLLNSQLQVDEIKYLRLLLEPDPAGRCKLTDL